ncbi:hypothetical protein T265_04459 [Opisthorchis viverrini]|uniref:Uncharacterized protein n=1 Tax=Opisthorchis viverrini TaxID=6198 RepID=A0A074ZN06_OPIVI|nr:hypothetical protein T265_04459 [Opisthorchis viverrini]KER28768.1 hypothetical protein T265_04459 [Opisthorchis viverrini]
MGVHALDTGHRTDLESVQRLVAEAVEISITVNRIEGVELASLLFQTQPPLDSAGFMHQFIISRLQCAATPQIIGERNCGSYNHCAMSTRTLSVPSSHDTRRHEGWDTTRLPKPRQGKSRGRGRVRTIDFPVRRDGSVVRAQQTDRIVRGSNPTSASQLSLSRLGQLGSIPAFLPYSGGMTARHQNGVTAERVRGSTPTSASRLSPSSFGQPGSILALVLPSGGMAVRHRKDATAKRYDFSLGDLTASQPSCLIRVAWQLGTERVPQLNDSFNASSPDVKPNEYSFSCNTFSVPSCHATRRKYEGHYTARPEQPGTVLALVLLSGGIAARRRKGATAEQLLLSTISRTLRGEKDQLVKTRHRHLDFSCLGLGNLALAQPSCFRRVAQQLGTRRVLQPEESPSSKPRTQQLYFVLQQTEMVTQVSLFS